MTAMREMDLRQIDCLIAQRFPELAPFNEMANVRAVAEWRAYRLCGEFTTKQLWLMAKSEDQDAKLLWVWKYGGPLETDVIVREVDHFSSDMGAATQVWEALRAQGVYLDIETYADFFAVTARHESGIELAYKDDPSLSKAICEVALLVNGVEVPKDA